MKLRTIALGLLAVSSIATAIPSEFPVLQPATRLTELFPALEHAKGPFESRLEIATLPKGAQTLEYALIDGLPIFEGDIVLPPPARSAPGPDAEWGAVLEAGVVSRAARLWPGGVIPYSVDDEIPNQSRIGNAIAHWNAVSAIRLVPVSNQSDYVRFIHDTSRCASAVGRQGGEQYIYLSDRCSQGSVMHEIGHTVGLFHEQSRNDRDEFIIVVWDNIRPGHEFNFNAFGDRGVEAGPYDFSSIMHYDSFAFAAGEAPTIVQRDSHELIVANRRALSRGDVAAIESVYRR